MWIEFVSTLPVSGLAPRFRPPATEEAIAACEAEMGLPMPAELKELLRETDGVTDEYDTQWFWPTRRIVELNRGVRENLAGIYEPFDGYFFFADAGNGDFFGCRPHEHPTDVWVWNHENDDRIRIASGLADFLDGIFTSRIR